MADTNTNETYRRRGKRRGLRALIILVIMAAVIYFAVGTFFRVSDIQVTGASVCPPEEIIAASGIEKGSSVLFVKPDDARDKIKEQFPYADTVVVKKSFPATVIIEVTESYPIALAETDNGLWIIDKNVRLLEKFGGTESPELMTVKGLGIIQPVVGEYAAVAVEDSTKLTYTKEILSALQTLSIAKNVREVDVSSVSSITLNYLDRFSVQLGRGDNSWDKLQLLKGVAERLEDYETGKIDLSVDGRAHFLPE